MNKRIISILLILVLVQITLCRTPSMMKNIQRQAKKAAKMAKEAASTTSCNSSKMVSCGEKIKKVLLQCASENDAQECVYEMLRDSPCYACIDKVLPQFKEVEDWSRQTKKGKNSRIAQEKKDLNEAIHAYATCGTKEMFECRKKVSRIYDNCGKGRNSDTLECMEKQMKKDTCKICICKIKPELCNQEQKQQQKQTEEDIKSNDVFGLLGKIGKIANDLQEAHGVQKEKKTEGLGIESMANSLGLFGTLGNLVNKETLKKISGVATALEGEKPQEKKNSNGMNPEEMGNLLNVMQGFMRDPRKTANLLDQLQINEEDLTGDNVNYDDVQQKITQKVMMNPQLLSQFLGGDYDEEMLEKLMREKQEQDDDDESSEDSEESTGSDDDEDDEESTDILEKEDTPEYMKTCSSDEYFEECKWNILKALPSCLDTDTKECLEVLFKKHPCRSCICRVIPDQC